MCIQTEDILPLKRLPLMLKDEPNFVKKGVLPAIERKNMVKIQKLKNRKSRRIKSKIKKKHNFTHLASLNSSFDHIANPTSLKSFDIDQNSTFFLQNQGEEITLNKIQFDNEIQKKRFRSAIKPKSSIRKRNMIKSGRKRVSKSKAVGGVISMGRVDQIGSV